MLCALREKGLLLPLPGSGKALGQDSMVEEREAEVNGGRKELPARGLKQWSCTPLHGCCENIKTISRH
jgi:hypothetical protein